MVENLSSTLQEKHRLIQVMEVQDVVANKDAHIVILQKKIQSAKTPEEKERFEKQKFELLQGREMVINSMRQIVTKCTDSAEVTERVLHGKSRAYSSLEYKEVAEYYKEKCFDWHDTKYQSAMEHLYLFANLLEEKVTVERIKKAIDEVGVAMKAKKEEEMEQ
ncbi:hypothetical protein PHYPO_G00060580 [Pangasianodon hypophthalmus]|uniref:Uncharacterized protein n=2 Tax=Pangasianodon hypophthalmus TaxID=310915 RepID=A0A5N5M3A5_PANHP|nr:hypothetical protein PHYPO_G00060580 [Pangasianodon hypophthalmus]